MGIHPYNSTRSKTNKQTKNKIEAGGIIHHHNKLKILNYKNNLSLLKLATNLIKFKFIIQLIIVMADTKI